MFLEVESRLIDNKVVYFKVFLPIFNSTERLRKSKSRWI